MKNKKKRQTLIFGIIILIFFGIIVVYGIVKKNNDEFREYVIENVENDVLEGDTLVVNNVFLASKKIKINDIVVKIKGGKLYINDTEKDVSGEKISRVTGYYYQPADTYNLFVLTNDNKVYSMVNVFESEINEYDFEDTSFSDADSLVLVDIMVENDLVGQLSERHRVYALIEKELVLLG